MVIFDMPALIPLQLASDSAEELLQIDIVRPLGKAQVPGVQQENLKRLGQALAQIADLCGLLLLLDSFVLFLLALGFEARPRNRTPKKIDQHMSDCLKIITAALLDASMGIDGGISCGACQSGMLLDPAVLLAVVSLAQAKVYQVDVVLFAIDAKHEIFRLDVTVDYGL